MSTWLLNLLVLYFTVLPFVLIVFAPASAALGVLAGSLISWLFALALAGIALPRWIAEFLAEIDRERRRRR